MTTILTERDVARLRGRYRVTIRRREVLEICEAFGMAPNEARTLLEGSTFVGFVFGNGIRSHYHRDEVIAILNASVWK